MGNGRAVFARTTGLCFGTRVYLAGLRHPLLSARSAAIVAALSADRLVDGLGVGWLEEEFEVLDVSLPGGATAWRRQ